MKTYFASVEKHLIKKTKNILLSYWDLLEENSIPFRKETFKLLITGGDKCQEKDKQRQQKHLKHPK
jgi:hypothetical protein